MCIFQISCCCVRKCFFARIKIFLYSLKCNFSIICKCNGYSPQYKWGLRWNGKTRHSFDDMDPMLIVMQLKMKPFCLRTTLINSICFDALFLTKISLASFLPLRCRQRVQQPLAQWFYLVGKNSVPFHSDLISENLDSRISS